MQGKYQAARGGLAIQAVIWRFAAKRCKFFLATSMPENLRHHDLVALSKRLYEIEGRFWTAVEGKAIDHSAAETLAAEISRLESELAKLKAKLVER